jgi:DNA excision repair protein ERCC-3
MYKPLIVQSDMTLLLETGDDSYEAARDELTAFAEMVKSPKYIHTYKITPLSLWNGASAGVSPEDVIGTLLKYSKYPIAESVCARIRQIGQRYGKIKIVKDRDGLLLQTDDEFIMAQIAAEKSVAKYFLAEPRGNSVAINPQYRGHIKQALMSVSLPAEDLAGYSAADKLDFSLKTASGFAPRDYQRAAVRAFRGAARATTA